MRLAKPTDPAAVAACVSTPRLTKYAAIKAGLDEQLELYAWNAQVSTAMMLPAHFAEVLTRNAVSEALATVYGPEWPWAHDFELSLPNPHPPAYNPRRDLISVRSRYPTTGKVIADLKFAFWGQMFTARHHGRVWKAQILSLFPNAVETDAKVLRKRIHADLDSIRILRNRIAHHEPILTRNLSDDLARILDLVQLCSTATASWLATIDEASAAIAARP